ncbi:MAG: hypothetical protein C4516_03030 [Oxalobacter sp.]|nr:MAG: hypothetical protein C4516_03030 [Oxalobacter sp.]
MAGRQKRIKKQKLFERSEFFCFPLWPSRQRGSQRRRGRLFWLTFFGETKKVSSRRATPGKFDLLQRLIMSPSPQPSPARGEGVS